MEPLAKLVVSALELAESELAAFKSGIVRLGLSLVFIVAAGVTGVLGLILLIAAAFMLLQSLVGTTAALAITGTLFLAATALLGLSAFHKATRQPDTNDASTGKTESNDQHPTIRIAS